MVKTFNLKIYVTNEPDIMISMLIFYKQIKLQHKGFSKPIQVNPIITLQNKTAHILYFWST